MTLLKTSIFNGLATAVRILVALVLNKVLAVYVGPAGYVFVGQLSNAIGIASSVSGGAIAVGVTRYTAEYEDDPPRQLAMWRAAVRYALYATALTSLTLIAFAGQLAERLLGDRSLAVVFFVLAVVMPLVAISSLLLAVVNGKKEMRVYATQTICASVLGCAIAAGLSARFGTVGALMAMSLNLAAAAIVTLGLCWRATWLKVGSFFGEFAAGTVRPLLGYALMTLTSAVVAAGSQLLVREQLVDRFGEVATGNWQAVYKVSDIYLTLFTATLGIYYLPRIAEIKDRRELRTEIARMYRFVLPASAVVAGSIFMLRERLVTTLFTDQFSGMVDLFGLQLLGDVLKVGSWVLGFITVGRGMVRWFVFTEVVFSASWVFLVWVLTQHYGLRGAPAAFACNYGLYWLFMAWLIGRKMHEVPT